MKAPEEKYWSRRSIETLAKELKLPDSAEMQDWAFEVADHKRLREFVNALNDFETEPDVQFTLMDIILQSLEDSPEEVAKSEIAYSIEKHLKANFELHAFQIWYWSSFESKLTDTWRISPFLRKIWDDMQ